MDSDTSIIEGTKILIKTNNVEYPYLLDLRRIDGTFRVLNEAGISVGITFKSLDELKEFYPELVS